LASIEIDRCAGSDFGAEAWAVAEVAAMVDVTTHTTDADANQLAPTNIRIFNERSLFTTDLGISK
jgi:hypothetical protein